MTGAPSAYSNWMGAMGRKESNQARLHLMKENTVMSMAKAELH